MHCHHGSARRGQCCNKCLYPCITSNGVITSATTCTSSTLTRLPITAILVWQHVVLEAESLLELVLDPSPVMYGVPYALPCYSQAEWPGLRSSGLVSSVLTSSLNATAKQITED